MARLILVNGPPGAGKSTIAQLFVDDHPLALNLDIDQVRRRLGGWQDHPEESGRLARRVALAMAREHLGSGHDVVVPQYLARVAFIDDLDRLADERAVTFHEVALMASKAAALRRFADRTRAAADPSHVEAQQMLERRGGPEPVAELYDRMVRFLVTRPSAIILDTEDSSPESTYRQLVAALA